MTPPEQPKSSLFNHFEHDDGNALVAAIALIIFFIAVALFFWQYYGRPPVSSVAFVSTHTNVASVALNTSEEWSFQKIIVCGAPEVETLPQDGPESLPDDKMVCSSTEETVTLTMARILLSPSSKVTVQDNNEYLELNILGDDVRIITPFQNETKTISHFDRIQIEKRDFAKAGSLTFNGVVTIGDTAESGIPNLLLEGRYEFREQFTGRKRSVISAKGDFFLGDTIWFRSDLDEEPHHLASQGFFSNSGLLGSDHSEGFQVVAATTEANPEIVVKRVGFKETRLKPSTTERLLSDPWFGLITTSLVFVALLPSIIELVNTFSLVGSNIRHARKNSPPATLVEEVPGSSSEIEQEENLAVISSETTQVEEETNTKGTDRKKEE